MIIQIKHGMTHTTIPAPVAIFHTKRRRWIFKIKKCPRINEDDVDDGGGSSGHEK